MTPSHLFTAGEFQIDFDNLWVQQGQERRRLRGKTAGVLYQLVMNAGTLVSKEKLLRTVWPDAVVGECGITTCIYELRQAFNDTAKPPRIIETVYRHGYRFIAPLTSASSAPLTRDHLLWQGQNTDTKLVFPPTRSIEPIVRPSSTYTAEPEHASAP